MFTLSMAKFISSTRDWQTKHFSVSELNISLAPNNNKKKKIMYEQS